MPHPPENLSVLMAPDWRAGNPYQKLLAEHLEAIGVGVSFLSDYRRGLPLARGVRNHKARIFHLHWPEAYFAQQRDPWDQLREMRFALDLRLAIKNRAFIATAHNLYPHNRGDSAAVRANTRLYYRKAHRIITHSPAASAVLAEHFDVDPARCRPVPHGDLSVTLPVLPGMGKARQALGLDDRKLCLMFGAVEPYKGIEEAVEYWQKSTPEATLAIVGRPCTEAYARVLAEKIKDNSRIIYHPEWMDDYTLCHWLAAANVVLFNYRAILVSGAATLVRSLGIPILLPRRLSTIDLHEPDPSVVRFEDWDADFGKQIAAALCLGRNAAAAEPWRQAHAWSRVAEQTRLVYAEALSEL